MDLSEWYVTLPVGAPDDPETIRQPALQNFSDPNFFYWSVPLQAAVFRAHCGGVTTTGSQYPRTELREMKGSELADWDITKGTHTMISKHAVLHLPDLKPEVVVAQVHRYTADLFVIHAQRQENGRLRLIAKNEKTIYGVLSDSWGMGDPFNLKIEAKKGEINVYFEDFGVSKATFSADSKRNYFKTGAYTQSSINNGEDFNAFSEVALFSVDVKHS